jgi:hypothetical protein
MPRVLNTPVFILATVYFVVDGMFSHVTQPIAVWLAKKKLFERLRLWVISLGPYPCDIVFMDNLRTHKIYGVRQAVEAVGARVRYLPAYSPDLNPIEMAFSKLKTALRKGAARTVTTLMKLIGKLIRTFAPEQCANYFRHAGYA